MEVGTAHLAEGGVTSAALEESLRRCRAALTAMAAARFRNPADAEDAVQEICVRVLSKAAGYRPEGPLDHWVLTVGANAIRDRARRFQLRNAPIDRPPDEPGLSPHDAVERRETLDRVRRAMDALESDYRAPLLLHYLHGLEQSRIALLLDISVETLRTRLYRAIRKVRETLKVTR
jgi:RNA polymerase sigma factor (sigma-70 family)